MWKKVFRHYFKFCNVSAPACSSMLKDDLQLSDSEEDSDSDQVSSVHPIIPRLLESSVFPSHLPFFFFFFLFFSCPSSPYYECLDLREATFRTCTSKVLCSDFSASVQNVCFFLPNGEISLIQYFHSVFMGGDGRSQVKERTCLILRKLKSALDRLFMKEKESLCPPESLVGFVCLKLEPLK